MGRGEWGWVVDPARSRMLYKWPGELQYGIPHLARTRSDRPDVFIYYTTPAGPVGNAVGRFGFGGRFDAVFATR